jgi:hypothetical protein
VVRPGVRQLLETVRPCPAYVLTRTSDLLAANAEALAWKIAYDRWSDTASGDDFSQLARRALGEVEVQAASTLC